MLFYMLFYNLQYSASSGASQKFIIHSATKVNNFTLAQRDVTKLGRRDVKGSGERQCKSEAMCGAEHDVLKKRQNRLSKAVNMSK